MAKEWSFEKFSSEETLGAPITFGSNLPEYRKMFDSHGKLGSAAQTLLVGMGSKTTAAEWQRFLHEQGVTQSEQAIIDIRKEPLIDAQNLLRKGYQVEDIDQSFERTPPVAFVQGDAKNLPFAEDAFDAVFTHLLGLNLDDFETILKNAKNVLKPNGKLFLIEHPQVFVGNSISTPVDNLINLGQEEATRVLDQFGFTDIEIFPTIGLTRRQYMKTSGRWTHEMDHRYVDRVPSIRLAIYARK